MELMKIIFCSKINFWSQFHWYRRSVAMIGLNFGVNLVLDNLSNTMSLLHLMCAGAVLNVFHSIDVVNCTFYIKYSF